MQGHVDFFAVIRDNSKYAGQAGGKPFPVALAHSPDGYLWEGNGNRYRPIDLWLLYPADDPTRPDDDRISVTFDLTPASDAEIESDYQRELGDTEWFRPLPHQAADVPAFEYVNRFGRRYTRNEIEAAQAAG